jgi:hypothetical protein
VRTDQGHGLAGLQTISKKWAKTPKVLFSTDHDLQAVRERQKILAFKKQRKVSACKEPS